jgi:hypothetical protein
MGCISGDVKEVLKTIGAQDNFMGIPVDKAFILKYIEQTATCAGSGTASAPAQAAAAPKPPSARSYEAGGKGMTPHWPPAVTYVLPNCQEVPYTSVNDFARNQPWAHHYTEEAMNDKGEVRDVFKMGSKAVCFDEDDRPKGSCSTVEPGTSDSSTMFTILKAIGYHVTAGKNNDETPTKYDDPAVAAQHPIKIYHHECWKRYEEEELKKVKAVAPIPPAAGKGGKGGKGK